MTFILNSFSGRLVKSISPTSFSGVVLVILDWIRFFCLFTAVEVVVGSLHMCWLQEQSPFMLAGRLALLTASAVKPPTGSSFRFYFLSRDGRGRHQSIPGSTGSCRHAGYTLLRELQPLVPCLGFLCLCMPRRGGPLSLAQVAAEDSLGSCCGHSCSQAAHVLWQNCPDGEWAGACLSP